MLDRFWDSNAAWVLRASTVPTRLEWSGYRSRCVLVQLFVSDFLRRTGLGGDCALVSVVLFGSSRMGYLFEGSSKVCTFGWKGVPRLDEVEVEVLYAMLLLLRCSSWVTGGSMKCIVNRTRYFQ